VVVDGRKYVKYVFFRLGGERRGFEVAAKVVGLGGGVGRGV